MHMENENRIETMDYHSAEFKLRHQKILYQFKIRKSNSEPMFAVVQEGSKALENIKEGDIVNMRYFHLDKTRPADNIETKIKYITKDSSLGFKNHYVVGLGLQIEDQRVVA